VVHTEQTVKSIKMAKKVASQAAWQGDWAVWQTTRPLQLAPDKREAISLVQLQHEMVETTKAASAGQ